MNVVQNQQSKEPRGDLRIRLLGPVTITRDGTAVEIGSKKARALLAYLAMREGDKIPRTVLTELLWGERSDNQARASLRQTLSELRSALANHAEAPLITTNETVTWASGAAWIDTRTLQAAHDSGDERELTEVVEFIGGELMEGVSLGEASFEQWLTAERERFRLIVCSVYQRLSEFEERSGNLQRALSLAQKLISLDALQEQVHRTLMRLYSALGRRDAALAQYERCRRELSAQLDITPQAETAELARKIHASRRVEQSVTSPKVAPVANPIKPPPRFDRPSIAVLPFTNLSIDPEQQYFGDGITEDIITELSRYHSSIVIARSSSFRFRGASQEADNIKQALGVNYIVEGSVRKAANRIRVSAQLTDAERQAQIWAERYDSDTSDIFRVQEDIARAIASTLEGRIAASGAAQARRKPTDDWAAYDFF